MERQGGIEGKQKREKDVRHSFKYSIFIYADDLILKDVTKGSRTSNHLND